MNLGNREIAIAALVGSGAAFLLALSTGVTLVTLPFVALAAVGFGGTVAVQRYGHLLVPLLTKRSRLVEVREGHEIPASQDCVVKRVGGVWFASMFLWVKVHESAQEAGEEERGVLMESFERAISGLRYPVKLSTLLYAKDLGKYRGECEERRALAEIRLSKARAVKHPDQAAVARFEREVAMWNQHLKRLAAGERPLDVVCYAMTTAAGSSREQAIDRSRLQASEVKSVLANALNCEVALLASDDMKRCFAWEFALPVTSRDLEDEAW